MCLSNEGSAQGSCFWVKPQLGWVRVRKVRKGKKAQYFKGKEDRGAGACPYKGFTMTADHGDSKGHRDRGRRSTGIGGEGSTHADGRLMILPVVWRQVVSQS